MKYALIIPDGCADEPQAGLDGKTPLQAADTPAMDRIATQGVVGRANNVPDHLPAGSDVANLSLLGYDVNTYFTGRAPLEAAAQDIVLGENDWAIRCNLVTVENQTMRDFTAGHISTQEATQLLDDLQRQVRDKRFQFVPGVSYRNLLIYRGESDDVPFSMQTAATPPHDLTDKRVSDDYPRGPGSRTMVELMSTSHELFQDHPVNQQRRRNGQLPATNIWLWGVGRAPQLPKFRTRFGVLGTMITAVDLLKGLARLVGWTSIRVPGATGYLDTDYAAKGRYAIEAISSTDLICVHIEAPDEASHEGRVEEKIRALEQIDQYIVAPLHEALQRHGPYRILVSPDHPTFLRTKTHSHGFVPWTMCGIGIDADLSCSYDEVSASQSPLVFSAGHELMPYFLKVGAKIRY